MTAPAASRSASRSVLSEVMLPVLRHVRLFAGFVGVVAIGAIVVAFVRPRRFEAVTTLATVGNPRLSGGLSSTLAASVLGASALNIGLQATPALMAQLLTLDGVLLRVAESPYGDETLLEAVIGPRIERMAHETRLRKLRRVAGSSYDRQTGLVRLRVVHQDSAVARALASRIVEEASATFVRTSKSQGAELRDAQGARVDSAAARVRAAEEALILFTRANRDVPRHSLAYLEQIRLERTADLARQVYTQAVGDRELAVAKLLEDTPAVVVVDDLPARLPLRPRFGTLILGGSVFVAMVLGFALLLVRERFTQAVAAGDEAATLAAGMFRRSR